ncbi:ABC transporter permease [Rhizobium leguminosarum bv. trifolii]|uniref:ABC transporter permease n=1 Tax=Rhizobium leguminosarum bv. trifolii TaxID=386 RepID=A0A3E1B5B2_RHILT|nr:ABC transporter permease [Rhizobium leguminosarum]RFB85082.1 ABC transporter permease [Rhizobium leguminosarum bv. trifolii]RFB86147.1 ABC transporter permease [Rhizobium leguminosarum bv. trifolii]
MLDRFAPLIAGVVFLAAWEIFVRWRGIPPYVLPAPSVIFQSLWTNAGGLMRALGNTALVTLSAFSLATISGIALGILIALFRTMEKIVWPYAVALQVTPIIAIAPLVIIWVGLSRVWLALLILSWLVAFFPMLSATVVGIKSVDRGLQNVFTLYRATRWQRLLRLQLPAALPFILSGARVSSGLSVIGAVVAEFVAGSGTSTGLAWTIVQSSTMLDVPRMFAALFLLAGFGVVLWHAMNRLSSILLGHWHESELKDEA